MSDFVQKMLDFLLKHGPDVALKVAIGSGILLFAWIAGMIAGSAARRALQKRRGGTLGPILARLIRVVFVIVGLLVGLDQAGIDIAAILAGAGIAGLAVGFGAQSLVKDVISGFFILLDDVIRAGDVAKVGDVTGEVEEVGLRVTRVRSLNGQLWYINNGSITNVGNYNRQWCRAIVDVGLAYEQDAGRGMKILKEIADGYAAEKPELFVEPPEVQGLVGLNASDVGVRVLAKVAAKEQWGVERELRKRVKEVFDEKGVEIPFPRQTVYHRSDPPEEAKPA